MGQKLILASFFICCSSVTLISKMDSHDAQFQAVLILLSETWCQKIFAVFIRENIREIGEKWRKICTSKIHKSQNLTHKSLKFGMEVSVLKFLFKKLNYFLWNWISSSKMEFLSSKWIFFLWNGISSFKMYFFPRKWNYLLRNGIVSSKMVFFPLQWNFFLRIEIFSSEMEFLP